MKKLVRLIFIVSLLLFTLLIIGCSGNGSENTFPYNEPNNEIKTPSDYAAYPNYKTFESQLIGKWQTISVLTMDLQNDGYLIFSNTNNDDLWNGMWQEIDGFLVISFDDFHENIDFFDVFTFSENGTLLSFANSLNTAAWQRDINDSYSYDSDISPFIGLWQYFIVEYMEFFNDGTSTRFFQNEDVVNIIWSSNGELLTEIVETTTTGELFEVTTNYSISNDGTTLLLVNDYGTTIWTRINN